MATFAISRGLNSVTINSRTEDNPDSYELTADTLNDILVINSKDGSFKAEIHALTDTVTVNGAAFSGTAAQLKTLLLGAVFNTKTVVATTDVTSAGTALQKGQFGIFQYADASINIVAKNSAGAVKSVALA